ncbi:GYDIA family GHMP kinase [Flavobacterium sp. DG1-102-2]|uniref:GYDIA family GHMP kinase n=1 Tax=Flavobacterium sp. DG1-102-2 TaxID=3081663 RepID=UPI002948CAAF|nr:GYDIA family GHMP kinase [Flavobacterium sp. DG1-102-2]MDV6168958.1 GYDIA family GHMP kinase [Flavobacterium sp. DG1-102-2]
MKKTFYSNGKLLITGEYTVLDGAVAFALPTKGGQFLDIENGTEGDIHWKSFDADGSLWYEASFLIDDIIQNIQSRDEITNKLIEILHWAWLEKPEVLDSYNGFKIETRLTFPKHWGLGTSSTLINNIAQWFAIDAFVLQAKTFGSSGYDIACAQHNTPILYHLDKGQPITQPITFDPGFISNLYFVYLNRKQNSRQAIAAYRERRNSIAPIITKINQLTERAISSNTFTDFSQSITEHEAIMSEILGLPPVKNLVFPDFNGCIKSLGAWGGDFIMAISNEDPGSYFTSKGFEVIIPYREMILE